MHPRIWTTLAPVFLWPALVLAEGKAKPVDVSKIPLPVPRQVDFAKEVYPIFKEYCVKCHGAEKQKGKYRIDSKEAAFKETDYGPTIVPGQSEKSALIHMVCGLVDEMLMPPPSDKPGESEKLTAEQIGILRAWIDQGAVWPAGPIAEFVKPVAFDPDIKEVANAACVSCHSGAAAKGGFDATSAAGLLAGGKSYGKVIVPGDLKKSSILTIISGKDEDLPQPEKHKLPPKQVDLFKKWIEQGAK